MMLKGGRSVEGNRSKSGKDKVVKATAKAAKPVKAAKPKPRSKTRSKSRSKRG
jgi:hypothetical protein